MIATTMMPEAYKDSSPITGLIAALGQINLAGLKSVFLSCFY